MKKQCIFYVILIKWFKQVTKRLKNNKKKLFVPTITGSRVEVALDFNIFCHFDGQGRKN